MSQVMPYEAWRITYQSSEQAARAAYAGMVEAQAAPQAAAIQALKRCARVLAGEEMSKSALINALDSARQVLQGVGQGECVEADPEWNKHVIDAWATVRKHNHSIPDDVLDEMKVRLLAAAPLERQQAYVLEDDGHETYLDGCESRFSIRRADGEVVAWVVPLEEDSGEAVAREIIAALNATHPTQQGLDALHRLKTLVSLAVNQPSFGSMKTALAVANKEIDAALAAQAKQGEQA